MCFFVQALHLSAENVVAGKVVVVPIVVVVGKTVVVLIVVVVKKAVVIVEKVITPLLAMDTNGLIITTLSV